MRRAVATVLVALLALMLASCGSEPPFDSGIRGLVTIGPINPVEQPGVPNDRPYEATILVKDAGGRTVATVKSGTDGRFTVDLEPGPYVLEPQSPGTLPFAQPVEVTVAPHQYAEVTIGYDSGIR